MVNNFTNNNNTNISFNWSQKYVTTYYGVWNPALCSSRNNNMGEGGGVNQLIWSQQSIW